MNPELNKAKSTLQSITDYILNHTVPTLQTEVAHYQQFQSTTEKIITMVECKGQEAKIHGLIVNANAKITFTEHVNIKTGVQTFFDVKVGVPQTFINSILLGIHEHTYSETALNNGEILIINDMVYDTRAPHIQTMIKNLTETHILIPQAALGKFTYITYDLINNDLIRIEKLDFTKKFSTQEGKHGITDLVYSREYTVSNVPKKYKEVIKTVKKCMGTELLLDLEYFQKLIK